MNVILINTPPSPDLETLELCLATAAFDQKPVIIFSGPGVLHLNPGLSAAKKGGKSATKLISAFPMYDCDDVKVCNADLEAFGLTAEQLPDFCKAIPNADIGNLMNAATHTVII